MNIFLTSPISFPGLGIEGIDPPDGFCIPGTNFEIKFYGVIIAIGVLLAVTYCLRRAKQFGVTQDDILNLVLICLPSAIVGARLYYVIFEWDQFFGPGIPWYRFLDIRSGGLAIYGGVIGAVLGMLIYTRVRKLKVLPFLDLTGIGLLLGQAIGRWGNFFNQEAFGCNTTLPWGMFSEATEDYLMGSTVTVPKGVTIDPAMPVHPTFLYESIWCFVGLALLAAYIKKRKFNGDIALRYLVWYGAGRFWIEALRTDSLLLVPSLGLRASQLVAAAAVVGGVALEIFLTRKYKSRPLMVTLALTAENRSLLAKVRKAEPEFTVEREELVASSPRKLFLERTNAYNERVKQQLKEKLAEKN